MTDQEQKVLNLTSELWGEFLRLPGGHDDDVPDFRFHIHGIQRIIIARGYAKQEAMKREFANIDTSTDVTMPSKL